MAGLRPFAKHARVCDRSAAASVNAASVAPSGDVSLPPRLTSNTHSITRPPSGEGDDAPIAAAAVPQPFVGSSRIEALPAVLQQLIIASAGRGARGAYCSCRALRAAGTSVLRTPDLLARFCLASWGPSHAIRGILKSARFLFRDAALEEREGQLRLSLRTVAEAGGDVRAHTPLHIQDAIRTGCSGVLQELLALLARQPEDSSRGLAAGLAPHVAACCSALCHHESLTGDMVRALVHAVTVECRVRIHPYTFEKALREISCGGRVDALQALLEAGPPLDCVRHALHYAVKTEHVKVVEMLVARGGRLHSGNLMFALHGGRPGIIRAVVAAEQRAGEWDAADGARGMLTVVASSGCHWPPEDLSRRSAALRVLAEAFGADPRSEGGTLALVAACAVQGKPSYHVLADQLMMMGADADAALLALCSQQEPGAHNWPQVCAAPSAQRALRVLLARGGETRGGAGRALRAALRAGQPELLARARELLAAGAVPAEGCMAALRPQSVAESGVAGVAEVEAGLPQAGGAGGPNGGEGSQAAQGGAAAADGRLRLDWAWELTRMGALPLGAVVASGSSGGVRRQAVGEVGAALLEACRRGDAEAVVQLAAFGAADDRSCTAAYWAAFKAGHVACMEQLELLGAVPAEVVREAAGRTQADSGGPAKRGSGKRRRRRWADD